MSVRSAYLDPAWCSELALSVVIRRLACYTVVMTTTGADAVFLHDVILFLQLQTPELVASFQVVGV